MEWISIDDKMPDGDFDWVLVYEDGAICTAGYSDKKGFHMPFPFDQCNVVLNQIKHWQPLPPPP